MQGFGGAADTFGELCRVDIGFIGEESIAIFDDAGERFIVGIGRVPIGLGLHLVASCAGLDGSQIIEQQNR